MSPIARRPLAALAAAFVSLAAVAHAAAQANIETKQIERSTDLYEVTVAYPATGVAAIDDAIATWATRQVDDFTEMATDTLDLKYSLRVTFDVARNDPELLAVAFETSDYLGGAHPNLVIDTFNFAMPDGWLVLLPEIFAPDALQRISELAVADLQQQLGGPDSMTDPDWIKDGAGPRWDNFGAFVLLPRSLVIRFPPYQVAAYAAGPQQVEIPLAKLVGLVRADWRVPVPSFDCAKAGSAPEKAICSDIELARLDRALADAYARSLDYADEGAANTIKWAQRDWLKKRNACGGDVACLSAAYEDRLSAL